MLLKGSIIRDEIIDELKEKVSKLETRPYLVIIQIGNDPASDVYIEQKRKMAIKVGFGFAHLKYDEKITEEEIISKIEELNADCNVTAILVQMPIHRKYDSVKIQNSVRPDKDVDGLTFYNIGALSNDSSYAAPCTALGVVELFKRNNIAVSGKNVVIVGRSNLVGRPLSVMLTNLDATVTLCHSKTDELAKIIKRADILIVAIGKANFVTREMIRYGTVVIDVGINRVDEKLCGDVDFENVKDKCSYITPVPGGVGPMTIAMLASNVYNLYLQAGVNDVRKNKEM